METEELIVTALIPAAGSGTRMGGERKQYRELAGEPLLVRTLRVLEAHPDVDHIVVAAPSEDVHELAGALAASAIRKVARVVPGGSSRQASVAAALAAVPAGTDIVLVHDGVRPFVPHHCLTNVIRAAEAYGAAALAVPVADTLRGVDAEKFGDAVDRDGLYRMQTPQAFRLNWFVRAHEAAAAQGYMETDDVALVQRIGHDVRYVVGSSRNIKITTPEDWDLARAIWASNTQAAET